MFPGDVVITGGNILILGRILWSGRGEKVFLQLVYFVSGQSIFILLVSYHKLASYIITTILHSEGPTSNVAYSSYHHGKLNEKQLYLFWQAKLGLELYQIYHVCIRLTIDIGYANITL